MPPDVVVNLFKAFVQADSTTTRRFGGTGLGLAISRQLAQRMGGDLSVTSVLGQGSTFTAVLPLARQAEPPRREAIPAAEPELTAIEPLHVLVAEDNPTNQLVIKTLLHQLGLQATVVDNGALVLAAWEEGDFDVVLMDIQMPVMDGPTATREIRTREGQTDRTRTTIIGLTANAMGHQVEEYRRAGMDEVVTKPIDVRKLVEALNRAAPA